MPVFPSSVNCCVSAGLLGSLAGVATKVTFDNALLIDAVCKGAAERSKLAEASVCQERLVGRTKIVMQFNVKSRTIYLSERIISQ